MNGKVKIDAAYFNRTSGFSRLLIILSEKLKEKLNLIVCLPLTGLLRGVSKRSE